MYMMQNFFRARAVFAVLAMALFPSGAADLVWNNPAGGNWSVAANWSPNQVPGANDRAFITNAATFTVTLNADATVNTVVVGGPSGAPTLALAGGTLNLGTGALIASRGTFTISAGTLAGAGDLTIDGALNWSAGVMGGTGRTIIGSSGVANLTTAGTKGLNRTLENSGSLTYGGTALTFGYTASVPGVINNLSGGQFTVTGDGDLTQSSLAAHAFNNTGTFTKSGGGATDLTGVTFNNSGTTAITAGSCTLNFIGTNTGTLSVGAGAVLNLLGNFTQGAGGSLSGSGTINFSAGAHSLDGAFTPAGSVNLSGATVTFVVPQTIPHLNFSAGTLTGAGDLTIASNLTWASGIMAGSGRTVLASSAVAAFSTGGTKGLNRTLENSGTANYSGTGLTFGYTAPAAGVINNRPGGVFNITGDGDLNQSSAAAHAFNNAGSFHKSGAGTVTDLSAVAFNNSGTAQVEAGTLNLSASGSNSGLIEVLAGSTLNLFGNFNNLAGATISGGGNLNFPNGTHNLLGSVLTTGLVTMSGATVNFSAPQTLANLTLAGGTLQGNGDVTITGGFNWSVGTMMAGARTIVAPGATATLSGAATKGLNRTLENSGTITYSGSALTFGYAAAAPGVINNLPGGVFSVTADGDFSQSSIAAHAFNNSGTFNKSAAGTDTDFNGVPFLNTGTVNLTSGTLSFNSGGSNTGSLQVPAGAALNLGGTFVHAAGSTLGGAGTINFASGTHNFLGQFLPTGQVNFTAGSVTIANPMPPITASLAGATVTLNAPQSLTSLAFSTGILQGNGDVTITGTLNWTSGVMMAGARTVLAPGATATWSGAATKGLNRTVENSGTITYNGSALVFGYTVSAPGVINNLPGGVLTVIGDGDFSQSSTAAHAVNNRGTFNKSGAGTDTDFTGVSFNNTGTVNLSSGALSFNSGGSNTGSLQVPAGSTLHLGGTFVHAAGSTLGGAGTINFDSGTHNFLGQFLPSGQVNFIGGAVTIANAMPPIAAVVFGAAVTWNAPQSLTSLTFSAGTLHGNGDVTITGAFNWTSGVMMPGARTILPAGATANWSGGAAKGLNRTVENSGTITYSGSGLTFGYTVSAAGIINNLPGGVFNVTADGDFGQSSIASHAFNNAGVFNKTGGGVTDFIGVPFQNSGTVNLTAGTLGLNSGGGNTASLPVPAGTTLNLGGTFAHAAGSTLGGAGTINFISGTHNFLGQFLPLGTVNFLGGAVTIANTMPPVVTTLSGATVTFNAPQSVTSLAFSSGTLQGNGDVTITDTLNWSSGAMMAGARTIVASGAGANWTGASTKGLNRPVDNSGTITYSGSALTFGYTAAAPGIINNLAGAVFSVTGEGDFSQSSPAAHAFNNSGTFNKTGAATSTTFSGVAFNNTAIFNVSAGTVEPAGLTFPAAAALQSVPGGTLRLLTGNLTGATTNANAWSATGRVLFDNGGPHQLEVMGRDLGNVPAGYTSNFAYGTLQLGAGASVTLINAADNSPGPEALYVDTLIVPAGATFNLAGLPVYARNTQITGLVTNGTISGAGEQFADLQVEALGGPPNASVGEAIALNWTVRNTTNASSPTPVDTWQDRVVLSTDDASGNGDDRTLATVPHTGAIAVGAAYSTNAIVTLPNNLSGNLHLFVVTDSGNAVYEFGYETNNSSRALPISVIRPDLLVTNASTLAAGTAGSTVPLTWTVTNAGPGIATADWSDRVYLSTDTTLDALDALLLSESAATVTPLAPGAAYTRSRNVTLPASYIGLNYLLVVADATLNQLESTETNNLAAVPIAINAADLQVSELAVAPAALFSGQQVVVRWSDTNSGVGPARGPWSDHLVVSNLTTGARLVDAAVYYDSAAGGAVSNGQSRALQYAFRLPDGPAGAGTLAFRVQTDTYNTVPEFNPAGTGESNNLTILQRTSALAAYPDLQVTNLTVTPGTLQSGQAIAVTWDTTNSGSGPVDAPFSDRLVARNRATAETLLNVALFYNPAVETNGAIAAGQARRRGYSWQIPAGSRGVGEIEFAVTADTTGVVFENNASGTAESNNAALLVRTATLAPSPDLTVTNIVAPASGAPGQTMEVAWTVSNRGNAAAAGAWSEQVFLADNAAGDNAIFLGSTLVPTSLGAGTSTARTMQVTVPAFAIGQKFVVVRVDANDQVFELNEANNTTVDVEPISLPASLSLSTSTPAISEAAGPEAGHATVIRNSALAAPLEVTLTVNPAGRLTVPASVTIPAGATSVSVPIGAVDNAFFEGDQPMQIVAAAGGYRPVTNTLTVTEDDVRALSLQVIASTVAENAGAVAALGYLSRNAETNIPLIVSLNSDDPGKLTVPPAVTLRPGERTVVFPVNAVDNNLVDGPALVKVQATAPFYNAVAATVTVTDNDTITLALSVADPSVTEGSGSPATIGTVTRSLVNARELPVLLTTVPTGPLSVPSRVIIPANQASVSFNINAPNDAVATGPRMVDLIAKAISDVGAVVESSTGSLSLQVLDNDGATLTLTFSSALVAEGATVSGRIDRNTATASPLLVALTSSAPGEAAVPALVTIPAGQASVAFNLTGAVDGISDGSKTVTITASAPGFNSGSASVNVSDIDLPDLRVGNLAVPTNGLTDTRVLISWETRNDGLAPASGSWVDRIYISKDPLPGGDTLLATANFNGSLAVGHSYTRTQSVLLPSQPGACWILVVTDDSAAVVEGSERNNVIAMPVTIVPAYRATVSTDVDVAANGTPIPIQGHAVSTLDGSPARFKLVTTRVRVMGSRRVLTSVTDGNGNFQATFQPLPNEAGFYTIGAAHPLVTEDPAQDEFTLLGLRANQDRLEVKLVPNQPLSGTVEVRNLSEIPLTGITASPGVPPGLEVALNFPSQLSGMSTGVLSYTITSTITQQANATFVLNISSAEGASLDLPGSASIVPLRPQLAATPAFLARGMLRDTQTVVSFAVVNNGGAPSGDLRVTLPPIPWLALLSDSNVLSLPPGQKTTVTLALNPPADLPLTRYDGNLILAGSGSGVSVPFQFRALSEAVGDLNVSVTDEYTYYVADAPKVTNATVRVRDSITGEVVAEGPTGPTGEVWLGNIVEGNYSLEVTAPKHTSYRGPVVIVPGTTNSAEAFISRQTVTYQWTVVPVEIQDTYRVQLESVFETEVPIPNVIVENPRIMPLVIAGRETQFEIRLRNEGLIAANGVRLNVPATGRFVVTPLVDEIGTIPAKGSLTIPVAIRLRSTLPSFGPLAAERAMDMVLAGGSGGGEGDTCEFDTGIPCVPKIPISVGYYYVCGPNNVLQVRPIDLTALCAPPLIDDCLEKILGAAESNLTKGNLLEAPCDILDAVLQCLGDDLSDCEKALLLAACQTLTEGPKGAIDGVGDIIDGCLCDFLAHLLDWLDFDLPDVHLRGSKYGTGNWTANYSPVFNTFGGTSGGCGGGAGGGGGLTRAAFNPGFKPAGAATSPGAVCARVRIRLEQEAVMTRTAFLGTLEVDNDGGDSLTGVRVTLDVRDSANRSVNELFGFRPPVLAGLSDVSGSGVIAAGGSASAQYTFIPTRDAAPTAPTTYHVGGTLRYLEGGQEVVVALQSSTITVMPDARLELLYFQQRDVYSDDPFTAETEPAEPFALGLLVKNNGAGAARNFRITSAQPKIVENAKGLLVDFKIIGTQVGSQPLAPTLTANLGTVPAGGSQVAQWLFTSSLQGKFKEYSASFQHVDTLGLANISLIDSVEIHELIHAGRTSRPGDDLVPDFLVNDDPDPENFPDRLYLSDGTVALVNPAALAAVDGPATFNDLQVQLTAVMSSGWNYLHLPNPGPNFRLHRVVRSDGRELAVGDEVWTTDRSFPSARTGAVRERLLHLLDFDSTGSYTLHYQVDDSVSPAILDVVDVAPNPQTNAVSLIDVIFSEPIDLGTFDYRDLTLSLDGGANLINSTVTISSVANSTYRINGLDGLTAQDGNYELVVLGEGVLDLAGNPATNSVAQSWAKGTVAPVIVSLDSVSPNPRNTPLATLDVIFSQPVDAATFDGAEVTLSRDGALVAPGALVVTALSGTAFRVGGLAEATTASGSYVLTIGATGVRSTGGVAGAGARSVRWVMDARGPSVLSLEQLNDPTRSLVVSSLDVAFSEPIDPATFDYRDLTLTRNGGANLITPAVQVIALNGSTYRISNFNSLVGTEGAYVLTVNAAAILDLAGNAGSGAAVATWTMDVTAPARPSNLTLIPDPGVSAADGLINTNVATLRGTLAEPNLAVRLIDETTGTDFGEATVSGTSFSRELNLTGPGRHRLRVHAVDAAANVSPDAFIEAFVDMQAPVLTLTPVSPSPRTNAVATMTLTSSEPLNLNTFTAADLRLTRDGGPNNLINGLVTLSPIAGNQYRINGLAALTEAPGNYSLTVDASGIEDLAGNAGTEVLSSAWSRLGTNTAPRLDFIPDQSVPERNQLEFFATATDSDVPTNRLTFSLEGSVPSGATIDSVTGRFTWTPSEPQGPSVASITVRVTDNGLPNLSSSRAFTVRVSEVNEPPVLAPIANQVAYVGSPLNVATFATDPDSPTNQLTFTLGPGAPPGARVHPTRGVFTWTPPPSSAGTTNQITVVVTDSGTPPYSDAKPFTVIVGDFLDLSLGFTVVQAGQTGRVPVSIAGNVDPVILTFTLEVPGNALRDFAWKSPAAQTGDLSIQPAGAGFYLLEISALPGRVLSRTEPAAYLEFVAASNQTSAFVPLRLSELSGLQVNGELVPKTIAHDGRVGLVGAAPLLEATVSTNGARSLLLHGTPGKSYRVERATNLLNPGWTFFGQATLTNQSLRFDAGPTNQTQYFRAREQ